MRYRFFLKMAAMVAAALIVSSPTPASAATYYVANSHTAANDANAGTSPAAPWRTIAKANATLRPGDTVAISGGTYFETINPATSGTENARITYRGVMGETVKLTGVAQCVSLNNRWYVTIDGIVCDRTLSSYVTLNNSHHIWIANSRFDNCLNENGWQDGILLLNNSHHNWIHDNSIGRVGFSTATTSNGGVMRIGNCCADGDQSHYNLIERNTLFYGGHHLLQIKTSYNVIRNNYFHNEEWMDWPEHAGTKVGHRLIVIEGGDVSPSNVQYNVLDGNIFAFSGRPPDAGGSNAVSIRAPNNVVRRNVFYYSDLAGLNLATFNWPSDARFTHIYHNTFFHNGYSVATSYKPFLSGLSLIRYDPSVGLPITDVVIKNNIFWQNNWGQSITYDAVSSAAQLLSHNWLEAGDPRFVNVAATPDPFNPNLLDFRLRQDSAGINAGGFLTNTTASGTGTAIKVADPKFFIDGYGIAEGDLIQLQGSPVGLRVVSVDIIGGVITVDQATSWSAGQGVTLAYSGSAPDLGAYEFAAGTLPAAPTNVRIVE